VIRAEDDDCGAETEPSETVPFGLEPTPVEELFNAFAAPACEERTIPTPKESRRRKGVNGFGLRRLRMGTPMEKSVMALISD
jgi:hypothetical protein